MQRRGFFLASGMAVAASAVSAQERQEIAPVLFVHGSGDNASAWLPTIWRFESNYYPRPRLFAADLRLPSARTDDTVREAGRSSIAESTAQLAQEIARVRRASGIERIVVVAHARAGNTLRSYLRDNPGTRIKAAVLCATPSHGVIVSDQHMRGSEFNGASPFLRALNTMPGGVPPGVPTFTLASNGMDKFAQPDGRFIGLPGVATGIDATSPALRGATNIVLPDADHLEVAYSTEAFVELYRITTGELPQSTRIRPEVRPTLSGRVSGFEAGAPSNIGIAGARLRIFAVDPETARRLGPELHERITPPDGMWGPIEANSETHYEFELTIRGYPTTHIYRPPFPRSSEHINLRPYLPAQADPKAGALIVITRPRGYFDIGRDQIEIAGQAVRGPPDIPSESTLRAASPDGPQSTIVVHFNTERIAALTWPLAERRVSVIEFAE